MMILNTNSLYSPHPSEINYNFIAFLYMCFKTEVGFLKKTPWIHENLK